MVRLLTAKQVRKFKMSEINKTEIIKNYRPRLRRKQVPQYLAEIHGIDITKKTLEAYATRGGGPLMQYAGRIPLYRIQDLDDWANGRLSAPVNSTAERNLNKHN